MKLLIKNKNIMKVAADGKKCKKKEYTTEKGNT